MSILRDVFAYLFDVGVDILASSLDKATGVISVQLGDSTAEKPDSDAAELWQQSGFMSRPAAPTKGSASCQALVLKHHVRDIAFATRDVRSSSVWGQLKAGEACVHATGGSQARVFCKANGAVVAYTTSDNTENGTSVSLYVGPDKIQMMNQFGAITIDSNGITLTAGQSSLVLGATGIATMAATQVSVAGSLVAVAGSMATCIGNKCVPIPGVNTAIVGPSGTTGVPAPSVYISLVPGGS